MERQESSRRIQAWLDLMEANEELLLAGIRRRLGAGGDVWAERRRLYEKWAEEHDRTIRRMIDRVNRALNDG